MSFEKIAIAALPCIRALVDRALLAVSRVGVVPESRCGRRLLQFIMEAWLPLRTHRGSSYRRHDSSPHLKVLCNKNVPSHTDDRCIALGILAKMALVYLHLLILKQLLHLLRSTLMILPYHLFHQPRQALRATFLKDTKAIGYGLKRHRREKQRDDGTFSAETLAVLNLQLSYPSHLSRASERCRHKFPRPMDTAPLHITQ